MRLSQSDLAEYLGVAQASVSQATINGHKCQGYPVRSWAVYDGSGRVAGYDVPTHVMQQSPESEGASSMPKPVPHNPMENMYNLMDQDRPVHLPGLSIPGLPSQSSYVDASQRASVLPKGQDYFRPASSGGAALVMNTAIRHDNGTARGALLVAGVTIGSLTGWEVSNKNPVGALLGAGIGYLVAVTGVKSKGQG